ncbi:hypothetical protein EAG_05648 [Camponotus floridanus]|uniref:Uncharacterized protein n=1 Tax=Camponotus floridanus TaxID=104421 RepID=E2A6Q9_CAMFO|nr:hypothetical protein EAG_05648 [Camponotus floridanus]
MCERHSLAKHQFKLTNPSMKRRLVSCVMKTIPDCVTQTSDMFSINTTNYFINLIELWSAKVSTSDFIVESDSSVILVNIREIDKYRSQMFSNVACWITRDRQRRSSTPSLHQHRWADVMTRYRNSSGLFTAIELKLAD